MKRILGTAATNSHKHHKTQGSSNVVVSKPRQVRKYPTVPQRASLENVPVEIQQGILHQMPDLPSLQALISASPSSLRAYQSQRHSILSNILLQDIHPDVLFDVLAIIDALKLPRNYDEYGPQLKTFIEQYKAMKASLHVVLKSLEPNTKENPCEFNLSATDVTKDCCDYALTTPPVTGHGLNHHTSVSSYDVRRIHRAFYRYELFTLLFRASDSYGEERFKRDRARDPDGTRLALERESVRLLDSQDRSFLFLALFKIWEVEELARVRDYIMRRYDELCRDCESDYKDTVGWETPYGAPPSDGSSDSVFELQDTVVKTRI